MVRAFQTLAAIAGAALLCGLGGCDEPTAGPGKDGPPAAAEASAAADDGAAPAEPSDGEQPVVADIPAEVEDADVKPETYGAIKPPTPAPEADELTLHGLAGYEIVTIYSAPDVESPKLGYLRIGQRIMVTESIADTGEGCSKGWHALNTGGFACANKGLITDPEKPPYMHRPPPGPKVDSPVPYDYAVIAKEGTPMWWRTADADEVMLAQEKYEATLPPEEKKEKPTAKPKPGAKSTASATVKPAKGSKADKREKAEPVPDADLPGVLETPEGPSAIELTEAEKAEIERKRIAAKKRAEERVAKEAERKAELTRKAAKLPLHRQRPFMERGNIISLGSKVREKGRSWWRTARGGYVPSANTYGYKPKDFAGHAIEPESGFPFGFVYDEEAVGYKLEGEKMKWSKRMEHKQFVDLQGEAVEYGGRQYWQTTDGLYIRASALRLAEEQPIPEGVKPWERWVDVSLEQQLLVAYEGDQPVYATLVSSGKKGNDEESFRTPKGQWRIRTKHVSSSMAGSTASDGDYSIQDVPWAMFFEGNYALHGAFWHTRFGRTRSHGCVNLGPTDARWLFYWTTPFVPEEWHGASAHEGSPGSMVVVR